MRIYGVDFTSAPGSRKPITLIACTMEQDVLSLESYQELADFTAFEDFLRLPGPWLAALDFPFGLPRKLLINLAWPLEWSAYVERIAGLGKARFEQTLTSYRQTRAAGDKHHLRTTDRLAGACSPMMLHRVPVAKMFFQGSTRLLSSHASILPVRPTTDARIILEGYPSLVARAFIGRQSYKSDERVHQTEEKLFARQRLLDALCSPALSLVYGLYLNVSPEACQWLVSDPAADYLDALLCAIQAAWASKQSDYGIPANCDRAEGWIIDAHLL